MDEYNKYFEPKSIINRIWLPETDYLLSPSELYILNKAKGSHDKETTADAVYILYTKIMELDPDFQTGNRIRKVIFNYPATIVFWSDGDKTIVKCSENEVFDPEKGLALCCMKKMFGNKGNYNNLFREYISDDVKEAYKTWTDYLTKVIDILSSDEFVLPNIVKEKIEDEVNKNEKG